jgi:hypothetical protein
VTITRLRESLAGLSDHQLVTHVARVFGFDRTGGRIRAVLEVRLALNLPNNGSRPTHDDGPTAEP